MLNGFTEYIEKEKLISAGDKILLTVSGGIDSVVMCALFHKSGIPFGIAHCNFQLRGEESDADENFVEELAENYNVPFHSITFETEAFAKKEKLSIQVAARNLRYEWFESIRKQFDYSALATAHHKDDAVETFFINLIRGTGIAGLHGILPKQGNIIRPLLFTDKESVKAFAKKHKLKHREDSSNASEKYVRNKIRHSLIPVLEELNPKIESVITDNMMKLRDVEIIFRNAIEKERKKIVKVKKEEVIISIKQLKKLNPLSTYLYEFLKVYHFNAASVEEIIATLDKGSGKQFFSPTHRLVRDRDHLLIQKNRMPGETAEEILITKKQKTVRAENLKLTFAERSAGTKFLRSEKIASLDFDLLKFPLMLRKWKKGDAFYPFGMKGKKKLSDFFVDKKFSLPEKESTWLLLSENNIVWVVGHRIDDRFKITEKTRKIYFAELKE